jgi:hypothetical protein
MSIDEAWAALDYDYHAHGGKDTFACARALAVAVFWRCYVNHYPCTREELCGPHAERLAEIERLGR